VNEITVACLCPPDGTRHPAGETVAFRETIDFRTAATARKSIAWMQQEDPLAGPPDILAMLEEFYLLHCIASWSIRDAKGKAVEVSKAAVREYVFPHTEVAFRLADFANGLYEDVVLGPLVAMASDSSSSTPTNGSTSARKSSATKTASHSGSGASQTPSKPSSTESIPMAAIAPI
jgi:hypothetical protein